MHQNRKLFQIGGRTHQQKKYNLDNFLKHKLSIILRKNINCITLLVFHGGYLDKPIDVIDFSSNSVSHTTRNVSIRKRFVRPW